jgi:hypothetical protein
MISVLLLTVDDPAIQLTEYSPTLSPLSTLPEAGTDNDNEKTERSLTQKMNNQHPATDT